MTGDDERTHMQQLSSRPTWRDLPFGMTFADAIGRCSGWKIPRRFDFPRDDIFAGAISQKRRNAPGFSLMEMVLVMALFSILSVILSQIFVSFTQLHRRVSNQAVLAQDMRFATEVLVRAVRNNQINYDQGALPARDTALHLKTTNGAMIEVGMRPGGTTGDCQDDSVARCLALSMDGGVSWQPITSKHVNVTSFDVYVRPSSSPFIQSQNGYSNNRQPFVTFHIGIEYASLSIKERVSLSAQTTVSSRVYLR